MASGDRIKIIGGSTFFEDISNNMEFENPSTENHNEELLYQVEGKGIIRYLKVNVERPRYTKGLLGTKVIIDDKEYHYESYYSGSSSEVSRLTFIINTMALVGGESPHTDLSDEETSTDRMPSRIISYNGFTPIKFNEYIEIYSYAEFDSSKLLISEIEIWAGLEVA